MDAAIALEKDAMTETYYDVEYLIYDVCHKFRKRHGGDFEEYLSIAHIKFVEAFKTCDLSRSQFTTWLTFLIWHGLLDELKADFKFNRYRPFDFENIQTPSSNPIIDLVEDLGDDAKRVVHIVFNTPSLLDNIMLENRSTLRSARYNIRRYLKTIGWKNIRISNSFREIRRALYGN